MEEVGTEEEKHVPMSLHINCLGWVVPQGNAAEGSKEEKASPVTASWGLCTPVAKGGHGWGRKPERFPQIPRDPLKTRLQSYSSLMEMSLVLCSALTRLSGMFLWAWQPGQESIPQIPTGQVTPASLSQDAEGAPCSFPVSAPCVHEDFHRKWSVLHAGSSSWFTACPKEGADPCSLTWGSGASPHELCPSLHQHPALGKLSWRKHPCTPCSAAPPRGCVPTKLSLPQLCSPTAYLSPSIYKHTVPGSSCHLPPPVPPRSNFVPIHSDLNPEYPPQHNTAHPLSESPLFHTVIKTSLPSEQFFLFLVPLSGDPWNFQLSPTPSLRVTPCPPFFVSQAGLPQPG